MGKENVTKYAEFCQFRKAIRGSRDYVIVGIDVAKDRHHAVQPTRENRDVLNI